MNSRTRAASVVGLLLAPFVAATAMAEGSWGGAVGMRVQADDNARKSDENPISERQDEVYATLFADYQSSWYRLDADYTASYLNYSKDSQDDRNQLEGSSSLFLGKPKGWVSLELGNERRAVYNAPEDVPISENLDERSLWYVEPALIANFGRVNSLTLSARAEDVRYRYNSQRDSEPRTARLTYQRNLSELSFIQLYGGQRNVAYPNGVADDYENQFAGVAWHSRLRLIAYELRAGYNKASFDDDDDTYEAPSFYFSLDYNAAVNQLRLELSQDISDTSSGNALQEDIPDLPQADGVGIDQIERQFARMAWISQALCARCETILGYRYQFDNYRRQNRDGSTQALDVEFNYRFTESLNGSARYERSQVAYDEVGQIGYDADRFDLRLRKAFGPQTSVQLFYSYEQRMSEPGGADYEQNVVGLGINYDLK